VLPSDESRVAKNLPQEAEKMALLLKLYSRLRLKVNEARSAVASVFQREFPAHKFRAPEE